MTTIHWAVLVLMCVLANLPFLKDRAFLVIPCVGKKWFVVLFEFFVNYLIAVLFSCFCETRYEPLYPKDGIFFVVLFCLFILFSYPGFVLSYLIEKSP